MKHIITIIFLLSLYVSCSSGAKVNMSTELLAPPIPAVITTPRAYDADYRPSVYLTTVKDDRTSPFLIKSDNRTGQSFDGDLGLNVQYVFRKALRTAGFSVTEKAPVALAPKIERWVATKKGNEVFCEAALAVDLVGPDGGVLNTAHYESFGRLHKDADNDEILNGLGQIMAEVIKQAIEDQTIIDLIKAY